MNNFDVSALVKAVERIATALEGIEASLDRISDTLELSIMDNEEKKEEEPIEEIGEDESYSIAPGSSVGISEYGVAI